MDREKAPLRNRSREAVFSSLSGSTRAHPGPSSVPESKRAKASPTCSPTPMGKQEPGPGLQKDPPFCRRKPPCRRTPLLQKDPPPQKDPPAEGLPLAKRPCLQTSETPAPMPCSYIAGPPRAGGCSELTRVRVASSRTQPSWWPRVKPPRLSRDSPDLFNFSLMRAIWQQHKICSYPLSQ